MKRTTKFLAAAFLIAFVQKAKAQIPLSSDVQTNTIIPTTTFMPHDVAVSPDGKYAISWHQNVSPTFHKVYKRGYTNTGAPNSASQDLVFASPPASAGLEGNMYSRVAMSNSGQYIVVYMENNTTNVASSSYNTIFYQKYFSNGVAFGSRVFVDFGMWPDIDIAADGTFNISYASGHYYYCPQAVYVKRYLASGSAFGGRITIQTQGCTGVGFYNTNIKSKNGCAFNVSYSIGNGPGFVLERYNSSGVHLFTDVNISGNITGQNFVIKPSGDMVTVSRYNSWTGTDWLYEPTLCRVSASGSSTTSTETLSTCISSSSVNAAIPSIGINDAGDYVIVFPKYVSNVYQGMYIQQYSVNDVKAGPEYPLSTINNTMTSVMVDVSDCSFVVSWSIGNYNYHKRFGLYPTTTATITSGSTYCQGTAIAVTGSFIGVTPASHTWQITESDAAGNTISGGYTWTSASITGVPGAYTFPGSSTLACGKYYTIKLSFPSLCAPIQDVKTIYIQCNPTPVITGPNPICLGSSAKLCVNYSSSPTTFIMWSSGSLASCINVSPTGNTVYSVLVSLNGCTAMANYTLNVTNNDATFNTATSYIPGSLSYSATATPTVDPGTVSGLSYYWKVSEYDFTNTTVPGTTVDNPDCWWLPSNQNQFFGYDYTTTYTSANNTGTAFNGAAGSCTSILPGKFRTAHRYKIEYSTWSSVCPWTSTSKFIYVPGSSPMPFAGNPNEDETHEIEAIAELTILPNPTSGEFTVFVTNDEPKDIYVFDIMGKIVFTKKETKETSTKVDISNLPKGTYMVKLVSQGLTQTKRIIKQ